MKQSKAQSARPVSKEDKADHLQVNRMAYSKFNTVEFAARRMPDFRNMLVGINDVDSLANQYGRYDAYTSMYFYPDTVIDYVRENRRNGKPSIAGFLGEVTSHYLFFDIDSKDNLKAKRSAERVLSFCYDDLGCQERDLSISFSGSKGYHIGIDKRVFGKLSPSEMLHTVDAKLRKEIEKLARVEDIDHSIKDKTRLWRLVNTRNAKSGLYKIQIAPDDFFRLSDYSIREIAREPQPVVFTDETGLVPTKHVKPVEKACELYSTTLERVGKRQAFSKDKSERFNTASEHNGALCDAALNMLRSKASEGSRNNTALVIASALRHGGYGKDRAEKMLRGWNAGNEIGLPEREILAVVQSAYRNDTPYQIGCNSMEDFCPYGDRKECRDYSTFMSRNGFGHKKK